MPIYVPDCVPDCLTQNRNRVLSMRRTNDSIFTKRQQAILAAIAFAILGAVLAYGILYPEQFEAPIARFILCATIAVYLSVFFFVLYPAKFELEKFPVLNLPVKTTGPIVLWLVVFLLLLKLMPATPDGYGRMFDASNAARALDVCNNDDRSCTLEAALVELEFADKKDITYYIVRDNTIPRLMAGIYIKFLPGDAQYAAVLHYHHRKVNVEFSRYGQATANVIKHREE